MSEWFKVPVLKTGVRLSRTVGSNPTPTAIFYVGFFIFPAPFSCFLLLFLVLWLLKREGKERVLKDRKVLTKDFILLAIPLAIVTALVLPFVVYYLAKELLKEERESK